jgi:steroid delta-isomerase-like uncharacterized protein
MPTDAKKLVEEFIKVVNSHDAIKIISYFSDDGILENVPLGITNRGKEEITAYTNTMLTDYPDIKFELKPVFGVGDWAGDEWVMTGTFTNNTMSKNVVPANGMTFSVRGTSIYQVRNGKFTRESNYYDNVSFLQQVGLMPGDRSNLSHINSFS